MHKDGAVQFMNAARLPRRAGGAPRATARARAQAAGGESRSGADGWCSETPGVVVREVACAATESSTAICRPSEDSCEPSRPTSSASAARLPGQSARRVRPRASRDIARARPRTPTVAVSTSAPVDDQPTMSRARAADRRRARRQLHGRSHTARGAYRARRGVNGFASVPVAAASTDERAPRESR